MRSRLPFLMTLLILLVCLSCKTSEEKLYVSEAFIPENIFTSGVEGPATDDKGNIFAVNFGEEGTVGMINPEGDYELFVNLPAGSVGNGIRINRDGNLLVADYTNHNVLEISAESQNISIYAHSDSLNQPNDLAIGRNGILYLSDPNWKDSTGNLWRVDRDGSVVLLESLMGTTNGIEVNNDENILYVNESVQRNVWAYDLSPEGEITNKRLLIQFSDYGMDGMRCDIEGNLHITRHGKGTVVVVSPKGKVLQEVQLKGKKPTNITFGGPDGRTCYVTMMDKGNLEFYRTKYPGREWKWNH